MMTEASVQYRKEDLTLVADTYDTIKMFVDEGLPKMWITLDKEEEKARQADLVKLGVTVEVIKMRAELEKKTRAANPLKVTDTAENLLKKYHEVVNKTLTLTKWTVDELTKNKSLFWADVHQKVSLFNFSEA